MNMDNDLKMKCLINIYTTPIEKTPTYRARTSEELGKLQLTNSICKKNIFNTPNNTTPTYGNSNEESLDTKPPLLRKKQRNCDRYHLRMLPRSLTRSYRFVDHQQDVLPSHDKKSTKKIKQLTMNKSSKAKYSDVPTNSKESTNGVSNLSISQLRKKMEGEMNEERYNIIVESQRLLIEYEQHCDRLQIFADIAKENEATEWMYQ